VRQEAGDKLRVTIISPGFVQTNFAESVNNPEAKAEIASMDGFAIPPDAIARGRCDSMGKKSSLFPPRDSIDDCV
jgi:NADP-dependent 3-hydroxy acid dehydrogenase YdfG